MGGALLLVGGRNYFIRMMGGDSVTSVTKRMNWAPHRNWEQGRSFVTMEMERGFLPSLRPKLRNSVTMRGRIGAVLA